MKMAAVVLAGLLLLGCGDAEPEGGGGSEDDRGRGLTKEFVNTGVSSEEMERLKELGRQAQADVDAAGNIMERAITEEEFAKWMAVKVELLETVGLATQNPTKRKEYFTAQQALLKKHGLADLANTIIEGRMMAAGMLAGMASSGVEVPEDKKEDYELYLRHKDEIDAHEKNRRDRVR